MEVELIVILVVLAVSITLCIGSSYVNYVIAQREKKVIKQALKDAGYV